MKVWKKNIIVLTISVLVFGSYTVKSLIDYRSLLHESVHGIIDTKESPYLYHTHKNKTLDASSFYKNNPDLILNINDYVIKFPHCLDLYVLELNKDGEYDLKGKFIGVY